MFFLGGVFPGCRASSRPEGDGLLLGLPIEEGTEFCWDSSAVDSAFSNPVEKGTEFFLGGVFPGCRASSRPEGDGLLLGLLRAASHSLAEGDSLHPLGGQLGRLRCALGDDFPHAPLQRRRLLSDVQAVGRVGPSFSPRLFPILFEHRNRSGGLRRLNVLRPPAAEVTRCARLEGFFIVKEPEIGLKPWRGQRSVLPGCIGACWILRCKRRRIVICCLPRSNETRLTEPGTTYSIEGLQHLLHSPRFWRWLS